MKINQLENDLLMQIKRLDIICKSKGLPRPKKDHILPDKGTTRQTGGTYVSPYSRSRVSPGVSKPANSGSRGRIGFQSNSQKRTGVTPTSETAKNNSNSRLSGSRFYNSNYTPPNRQPRNNSGSNRGSSPLVNITNQNKVNRGPTARSPSQNSQGSQKFSVKSSGYGQQKSSGYGQQQK